MGCLVSKERLLSNTRFQIKKFVLGESRTPTLHSRAYIIHQQEFHTLHIQAIEYLKKQ